MNAVKKTFNVLGILVAWILSIALVILLIATPIVFSALSLLDADTITKALTQSLAPSAEAQEPVEQVQLVQLSNTTEATVPADDVAGSIDPSQFGDLSGIFGGEISQEALDMILSSDVAKEFIDTYVGDITNVLTGEGAEAQLDAEKIKTIVNDNIDEIADILQKAVPELADIDTAELKDNILKAVDEGAEDIVQALPKPEDIKQEIMQSNPELEMALEILAQKNNIKLAVIGVLFALSLLIFLCRIPGLRGFRWVATDLFVGGGFGALVTVGLLAGKSMVSELTQQAGAPVAGIVSSLLGDFTTGMLIRTVVMLVAGGVLLTVYLLIKKCRAKKLAAAAPEAEIPAEEAPAEETPAEAEAPAEEAPAAEAPAEEPQA